MDIHPSAVQGPAEKETILGTPTFGFSVRVSCRSHRNKKTTRDNKLTINFGKESNHASPPPCPASSMQGPITPLSASQEMPSSTIFCVQQPAFPPSKSAQPEPPQTPPHDSAQQTTPLATPSMPLPQSPVYSRGAGVGCRNE